MSGVQCQQIKVKGSEISKAVEAGCQVMIHRTAGKGFPVLLDYSLSKSIVVAAVQRVLGPTLLYARGGEKKNVARQRWRGG